eukprot:GFYU01015969.1.p1 GENE.GFYU01015969.1~~GFYU01015969.1.p1  ORF type:complete len:262 (-),score=60.47 GFYU01015969.1:133-918(-)
MNRLVCSFGRFSLAEAARHNGSGSVVTSTCVVGTQFRFMSGSSVYTDDQKAKMPTFKLNELPAPPRKQKMRLGRGHGTGKGKTGGKGHKGSKARSGNGKPAVGFEGGQTPLYRRLPKRGFTNVFTVVYEPLSLDKLQDWIAQGRIDASQPINMKVLADAGCVGKIKEGVKVLSGHKEFTTKVDLEVSRASKSAIEKIESAGGNVTTKYYNKLGLRALLKPEKFDGVLPREARPPPKKAPYYESYENRGYLAGKAEAECAEA